MQVIRRKEWQFDIGFLAVLAICLLAIWPFISRSALPQATDAELHIFRLAEISRLVRSGELYPRWAPNFYYGFGYPIFNYYAPLSYYLGLIVEFLPVLGPVDAVKTLFVLGLLAAGLGMYGFVRDNWGRPAGLVAAAVYIYAPYIQFIDPHARGDLAEAFSFGVFPLALWAMDRLRRQPSGRNWLASIGLSAALILTHNLMALVFSGILLAWVIWQTASGRTKLNLESLTGVTKYAISYRLFLALFLGVGLSAFFWLTIMLEQDAVNLGSLVGEGGHFDFRNHFLTWEELLSPSRLLDWGASEPQYLLNLGVAQWVFAGLGIVGLIAYRSKERSGLAFFVIILGGLLFLMVPVSAVVWENLPLLPFLQFPWRLLGPAAATIAVLSGAAVAALITLSPSWLQRWIPALMVGIILLMAFPLSQVPPWPADFGSTSAQRVLKIELAGRWLGTTSTADFVPATVDVIPKPESALLDDFYNERSLDRVNRVTLPEGTVVTSEQITPLHMRFNVSGDRDFPLRLFLFDFPGWQAHVDGQLVDIELGRPEGFVTVPVKSGVHVVEVQFATTASRTLATLVTLLALVVTLIVARMLQVCQQPLRIEDQIESSNRKDWEVVLSVAAVGVVAVLLQAFVVEPQNWLHYESSGFSVATADQRTHLSFGDQITLIGYDATNDAVAPGDKLTITLYWKAQQMLDINYQVFVHLLDQDGNLAAQSDKLNPGEFPSKRWSLDRYVRDEHQLILPADFPAGEYRLSVGLWVADDGWRLPLLDVKGRQLGDSYVLPEPLLVE